MPPSARRSVKTSLPISITTGDDESAVVRKVADDAIYVVVRERGVKGSVERSQLSFELHGCFYHAQ